MLAKLTAKNQITIPKKVIEQLQDVQYFDVELKEGVVLLKPVRLPDMNLDEIRAKMKKLGLGPDSVAEAIEWAKSK